MLAQSIGLLHRSLGVGAALQMLLVLPASAAGDSPAVQPVGAWTLALDGGNRQCRLTLTAQPSGSGSALAMPAGCHRAFPILASVAEWSETGDGRLRFDERGGQPVLAFERGSKGLQATSPEGEIYRLEPVGPHRPAPTQVSADQKASARDAGAKAAQPVSTSTKPADIAGRYTVLRDKSRDTGCMVTLEDQSHGPKNTFKARLAPACRDQGIVIFDPVGWQVKGGQLVLTARKGHTTELDPQDDGSWRNAPKQGKSLALKKM